jgi:general stress protein 26
MAGKTDDKTKVIDLIKGMHIAMLATRGPDGKYRSRPMAVSDIEFDGHLYFLTGEGSGKAHDLEKDGETVVTFADSHKSSYVALRGTGAIIHDRAQIKKHWSEAARGWFPKGVDDPNLALIRVTIEEAEFWDAPSGKMVVAYAYAKAMLTGEPPKTVGDHGKVSL